MVSTNMMLSSPAANPRQPSGSWILLRGLARQAAHWGDVPTSLSTTLHMPVYCPDLPGMGMARDEVPAYSLQRQTQQLLARISDEIAKPWYVVGMSLGGMVALELARTRPDVVAGVVVINSSLASLSPFYQRLRWQAMPTVLRCLLASAMAREALILQRTSALRPKCCSGHPALPLWQQIAQQQPLRTAYALRQLWAASRFHLDQAPRCHGMVLSSEGDQLVMPSCSDALADYLRWPQQRHPWAGHDLALDDADWLLRQLATFYHSLSSK